MSNEDTRDVYWHEDVAIEQERQDLRGKWPLKWAWQGRCDHWHANLGTWQVLAWENKEGGGCELSADADTVYEVESDSMLDAVAHVRAKAESLSGAMLASPTVDLVKARAAIYDLRKVLDPEETGTISEVGRDLIRGHLAELGLHLGGPGCTTCGGAGIRAARCWRDGWGDPRTRQDAIMAAPCPVCGAGKWGEELAPPEEGAGPFFVEGAIEPMGEEGPLVVPRVSTTQWVLHDAAAEASRQAIERLNAMDLDERTDLLVAQSVRAGIYTEEGELTERYGGEGPNTALVETTDGLAEIRQEPDGTLAIVRMVDEGVEP